MRLADLGSRISARYQDFATGRLQREKALVIWLAVFAGYRFAMVACMILCVLWVPVALVVSLYHAAGDTWRDLDLAGALRYFYSELRRDDIEQ